MDEPARLFEIETFETETFAPDEAHDESHDESGNYQALGVASEHAAMSRLLQEGHHVAVPVTDDAGVDLIVDYYRPSPILVQVKSSAHRNAAGSLVVSLGGSKWKRREPRYLKSYVDVVIIHARDRDEWWVIPARHLLRSVTITVGRLMDQWADAWDVFSGRA